MRKPPITKPEMVAYLHKVADDLERGNYASVAVCAFGAEGTGGVVLPGVTVADALSLLGCLSLLQSELQLLLATQKGAHG